MKERSAIGDWAKALRRVAGPIRDGSEISKPIMPERRPDWFAYFSRYIGNDVRPLGNQLVPLISTFISDVRMCECMWSI